MYNLDKFGQKMLEIRKLLELSQEEVSSLSGVSSKTIIRIEKGEFLPKNDTLEDLSITYKTDVPKLLLEYRISNYQVLEESKDRIFVYSNKLIFDESLLKKEIQILNTLLLNSNSNYFIVEIKQLILYIEALILYGKKDFDSVYQKYIDLISLKIKDFSMENFYNYYYPSFDLYILMNIGTLFYKFNDNDMYIRVLCFVKNSMVKTDINYPKICYNLGMAYKRLKRYDVALELYDEAIDNCKEYLNFNILYLIFYAKALVEINLNNYNYLNSTKNAIELCDTFGLYDAKNTMIQKLKKFHNINYYKIKEAKLYPWI